MVPPILGQVWENLSQYNWGSATLAWLYRQLCDACRRSGADSNLGGCACLLQIWIWERFPVWPYEGEGSDPTVAFIWKNVLAVRGKPRRHYNRYINGLDCITQAQVFWQPYRNHAKLNDLVLSDMCTRDKDLWRSNVPLVFFYVVEMHLPSRVLR
ncbi:hypothetical protein C2845_PM13G09080 [Panicum miliaceum]|uniref:Aminotransferase-like plant mobile domain-containing protein n=1 Tax=Panicum miliaceum TaxID=4540 RepID=A0A3L6RHM8_PANMI|nr:hypothetical protein C2845_PM13G09080 [Panicum miliaceum]